MSKTEVVTGTMLLRQALRNRMRRNFANQARNLGVPMATLEAFCAGTTDLSPALLTKLTPELFPDAVFDAAIDRLRPARKQEPQRMAVYPPRYVPSQPPMQGGVNLGPAKKQTLAQRLGWAK